MNGIIAIYYKLLEATETDFINLYSKLIEQNTQTLEEYALVMDSFKNTFAFLRYYYPALLYIICMGLSGGTLIIIRIIAKPIIRDDFQLRQILNISVSRRIIVCLMGALVIKTFITDNGNVILVATDNLILIIMVILFVLGLLFEVFMIKYTESKQHKFFLIMMSVFCLIFFKTYFVIAGFIEGTFQIRRRLNKA